MEPFLVSTERSYFLDLLTEEEKLRFTKNELCALTPYGINMNASYEPSKRRVRWAADTTFSVQGARLCKA